jgi:hypothetical protein
MIRIKGAAKYETYIHVDLFSISTYNVL